MSLLKTELKILTEKRQNKNTPTPNLQRQNKNTQTPNLQRRTEKGDCVCETGFCKDFPWMSSNDYLPSGTQRFLLRGSLYHQRSD